MNMTEFE